MDEAWASLLASQQSNACATILLPIPIRLSAFSYWLFRTLTVS